MVRFADRDEAGERFSRIHQCIDPGLSLIAGPPAESAINFRFHSTLELRGDEMPPFGFLILPVLFWVVVLGGAFYLAIRFLRAFEYRDWGGPELLDMRKRMSELEDAFEEMSKRVERIGESQEFTTRLLTERPGPEPKSEPGS